MALRSEKLAKGFALPSPPPRTPIGEDAAQRFEAPAAAVLPMPKRAPKPSRLRRDELGERLSIYVPPVIAEELRVLCARQRRSVSDATTEALAAWLKGQGVGGL